MIQVTAAVIRSGNRILLARRPSGSHLAGLWEFPGGKIEPGETPEQCLARERGEEFQVQAEVGAFVASSRFSYDHLEIELLAFEARLRPGTPALNSHEEIEWVPAANLLNYDLAPADIPIAQVLVQQTLSSE